MTSRPRTSQRAPVFFHSSTSVPRSVAMPSLWPTMSAEVVARRPSFSTCTRVKLRVWLRLAASWNQRTGSRDWSVALSMLQGWPLSTAMMTASSSYSASSLSGSSRLMASLWALSAFQSPESTGPESSTGGVCAAQAQSSAANVAARTAVAMGRMAVLLVSVSCVTGSSAA